jgi:hypothetical protein
MLRSTSTLSVDAWATAGFPGGGAELGAPAGGDSSSPRMLSRSIAFALSWK